MDPYSHMAQAPTPSSRAEADRWLAIAEKLLANRDLVGSKTFAIRARESDPRLESADQILALADTLIASDKRLHLPNTTNFLQDWYSVLQLPPLTTDSDLIAAHYRGLAILLNPNRSRLPFAHQAFQIVSDAWSVLSNPAQKAVYDQQIAIVHRANDGFNGNRNESNVRVYGGGEDGGSGFDADASGQGGDNGNYDINSSRVYETNPREDGNATGWVGPGGDNGGDANGDDRGNVIGETFWTACPYCYNMYEYPKAYEECTMRCQNCRRAFHGAKIPSPPLLEGEGEGESTYATWGFYPLGVSMSMMETNKGGVANWTPFSPMFSCPSVKVVPEKKKGRPPGPVVYIDDEDGFDDDDVFFEDSEPSEESDDEWGSTRKRTKSGKRRSGRRRRGRPAGRSVRTGPIDDVAQEGGGVVTKAVSGGKKQVGKAMKERGKLDLNVEFNNEGEENANGAVRGGAARVAHGEEDGEIVGNGFFEGLDEFLSSLPILNVVGDDKVKAA